MLPQLHAYEERFQQFDISMQIGYHELNNNISGINNDMSEKFVQLLDRLDKIDLSSSRRVTFTSNYELPNAFTLTSNIPDAPLNVLSRWPWVDKDVMDSIALGEFDIYHLPKLHREHTLRNHHVKSIKESYNIPLDDSRPNSLLIVRKCIKSSEISQSSLVHGLSTLRFVSALLLSAVLVSSLGLNV